MIRPMTRKDESAVRQLTTLGHPEWKNKPRGWYMTEHRTLVYEVDDRVVGYATYGMLPSGQAYGCDVVVHPHWQGKGIGGQLHGARLQEAQAGGATYFVGFTRQGNERMRKILEGWGGLYTGKGEDGNVYTTRFV